MHGCLACQVYALCTERFPHATRVSLIGGSLGGVFARVAAAHLFPASPADPSAHSLLTPRGAGGHVCTPCAYVSLATPHCGVHELLGRSSWALAAAGSWLAPGLAELLLTDRPGRRFARRTVAVAAAPAPVAAAADPAPARARPDGGGGSGDSEHGAQAAPPHRQAEVAAAAAEATEAEDDDEDAPLLAQLACHSSLARFEQRLAYAPLQVSRFCRKRSQRVDLRLGMGMLVG